MWKHAVALSVLLVCGSLPARAGGPLYAGVGETARPPIGWVEFCAQSPAECAGGPTEARVIVLTATAWDDLEKVNRWANASVKPMTDMDHWGTVEKWSLPEDGYGDCEDYVLLKRHVLVQGGWPRQALLVTVVREATGDGHAVLTVKTNRGEFILDNQNAQILPWAETGYRFVKRQSQTDPNVWVRLNPSPQVVAKTEPQVLAFPLSHGDTPRPGNRLTGFR